MRIPRHSTGGLRPLIWLLAACAGPTAIAAELSPYSLPSQQRVAPAPEPRDLEQRAPRSPTINESYYQDFKQKADALKRNEREKLRLVFSQRRDQAVKAGRMDEAQHYLRLVHSLDKVD